MANNEIISDIQPSEVITAERLNKYGRGLNLMAHAIRAPKEVLQPAEETGGSGASISNEVFACTVTESDQTVTDDNGDELVLKRVDTLSCVEGSTGRTMTFNITYS
jgi:hypothetical protein